MEIAIVVLFVLVLVLWLNCYGQSNGVRLYRELEDLKKEVLELRLRDAPFKVGDYVEIKNSKDKGFIEDIEYDYLYYRISTKKQLLYSVRSPNGLKKYEDFQLIKLKCNTKKGK